MVKESTIEKSEKRQEEINRLKDEFSLKSAEAEEFCVCYYDHLRAFELSAKFDSGMIDAPDYDRVANFSSADTKATDDIQMEYRIDTKTIKQLIDALRDKLGAPNEFGQERSAQCGMDSIINALYQGHGEGFYPSVMDKAAHLVYEITKKHPFVDGNKRIASFLFCWFIGMHNPYTIPRIGTASIIWVLVLWITRSETKDHKLVRNLIMQLIAGGSDD